MMHSGNNLKAFFAIINHQNEVINILMLVPLITLSQIKSRDDKIGCQNIIYIK